MGDNRIDLVVEVNDIITYAIYQNGLRIVRSISLKNNTEQDIENLMVKISSASELIVPYEQGIQVLRTSEEMNLSDLKVLIKGDYLASLTERITCTLKVELLEGENVIAACHKDITALAYDEWPGLRYFPDFLAAFVTPNHPVIADLLQSTSKWLQKWTSQPSLEGYQCQEPNRVKNMAAAAYAAIQERNITYANPPSSFETIGQRVRLCDTVMEQHLGTCMDMALLYASVLEAIGLNPILVLIKGHIFAGVWLVDQSFADPLIEDPSQLEKRMASGIHELIVVECTAMCAGKTYNFETAMKMAEHNVSAYGDFQFAIDVMRARRSGVRPLPVRIKGDTGYVIQHEDRAEKEVTERPDDLGYTLDFNTISRTNQATKQTQWERKLLDLSMRNMLINMRLTKAVVPLLTADIGVVEDALADGEEFQVTSRPLEWDLAQINVFHAENTNQLGPYKDLIALECKHKRIPTIYSQKELNNTLTKMYRSAKSSLEENGASTLYLAMGLLRWFEKRTEDAVPRYAPIVLIPIEIIRKSASKGYTMRMRDEDAQINITMLEFLKQNYNIVIGGLNPIPMDEHGLDMKKIFAIIRHAIIDETMWDIVESCFIGNFSFSQFVMWNDIHNKTDFLERNKIVRSLIKGAVDWDCTIPENVDTDEAYLPITADSSQLRAINMAANEVSFVLHGPPGTGKSQTITAMIANALTRGRSVLFVAEKMAALEVVQKRLDALGIGDFCLELHSNKATKKAVLDQLKQSLELDACGTQTEYESKIQDIRRMRENLDAYVKALHTRRSFGKSLRELIDLYETIPACEKEVVFDQDYAGDLTQSELDNQRHVLERLVAAGRGVGHPSGHVLKAVQQTEYSQSLKLELEDVIGNYLSALECYKESIFVFADVMGIQKPEAKEEWVQLGQYAEGVASVETIPQFLMKAGNIDVEFLAPMDYVQKAEEFQKKKEALLSQWNENFLCMDMSIYRKKYDDAGKKFLGLGKGKALNALKDEMQAFASFPVLVEKIPVLLADVELYQKDSQMLETAMQSLSPEWRVVISEYLTVQELQNYQRQIKSQWASVAGFSDQLKKMEAAGTLESALETAKSVLQSSQTLEMRENKATELLRLAIDDSASDWLQEKIDTCKNILDHAAVMKDWIVYRQFAKEARDVGLAPVCEVYEAGLSHDDVMNVYLKSVYKSIVLYVIESEPALNSFTGIGFNERIMQFKKLDQEFMELTKDEMYYKLTHNLPSGFESVEISKELNSLRRAISSNGRGISIRSLFEQIPNVLKKLCPCMLMSPISVAQYLSADTEPVDIVIFDEASQLPTCKAVGVLARGRNAVIVGDPNQMPPTSFFTGNTVDEDNLDIEDLDSILDDCLALGMPQAHLQWHYRSKHESLIAFSNQEFYENGMLTFPSRNDRERRVSFEKLDGFFDRGKGRVNQAEGEAIVKEIKRRYADPVLKEQSIGVVTFNISQQTLIEDMLAVEYQKNADFDAWANTGDETLFVKNLENVQGDERDVILFSIAYGPDAEGKLTMNFGPLNKDGGWKRLNVAVSRARYEMVVYSIMTADMIDLRRTKARGVEALKNFIEFADKGKLHGVYQDNRVAKNQGIMGSLCREIAAAGYEYQIGVGHSNFKIDIAVLNPYNKDEYLLGIMLDGETYRQSANTKDREVSQVGVLRFLGWELERVWTMDWWDNRDKEIRKILRILDEKKAEARFIVEEKVQDEEAVTEDSVVKEVIAEEKDSEEEASVDEGYTVEKIAEGASEPEAFLAKIASVQEVSFKAKCVPMDDFSESQERIATVLPEKGVEENAVTYEVVEYIAANVDVTPLSTSEYVQKEAMVQIVAKANAIIEAEAPISYDRLVKKILRSFDIGRSSVLTLEATDKALKKAAGKLNRQNGMKFYWKEDQDLNTYFIYRNDAARNDSRSINDVSQQEIKNAVCKSILDKGVMDKETLLREAVRTMGYKRTTTALLEAAERGLKYGRKTGEIVLDEEKRFSLAREEK